MTYKRDEHWHLDVTVQGVRYREALNTTDKRQAKELEKTRVSEIKQGKGASKSGREFARKPFGEAVTVYPAKRKPHVSERTTQFEKERLGPLTRYYGEKPLLRFKAEDFTGYQTARLASGIWPDDKHGNRRASSNAEAGESLECHFRGHKGASRASGAVGKVLSADLRRRLFEVAASKPEWAAAHCAAVLAVSTTCPGSRDPQPTVGRRGPVRASSDDPA